MNWLTLSVLSGLCAALNGLFAKLVTDGMSRGLAEKVAACLGVVPGGWGEDTTEGTVRVMFFLLNVAFNAIMWGMFTAALTRGPSATKVSVVNTSSNFMLTALLGSLIFSERLPPQWFLGATCLIIGNVIIGRRGESSSPSTKVKSDEYALANERDTGGTGGGNMQGTEEEDDEETEEGEQREKMEIESLRKARRDRLLVDFGSDTEGATTGRETPGTTENEESELSGIGSGSEAEGITGGEVGA